MNTTPTPTAARRMLARIIAWLPLLDHQAHPAPPTPPTTSGPSSGPRRSAPPPGLARALDQTSQGPTGIRTSRGVQEILTPWARQLATDKNEPIPPGADPLHALHTTLLPWAQATGYPDLDALHDTIHDIHDHIARATGHAPAPIDTCPHCGAPVLAQPTPTGIPGHGACARCDTWWPGPHARARARRDHLATTLRTTTDPRVHAPWPAIHHAYPALTHARLRQWAHRGKVHHDASGYSVADINRLLGPARH